jgi:hypothetical protein
VALRHLGLAGLHALGADGPRQVLGADLPVAMHQHDQRLGALVLHHQGLDHLVLGPAELARRLGRAAVVDVVVHMLGEGHPVGLAGTAVAGVSLTCLSFFATACPVRSLRRVAHLPAHGVDGGQQFRRQVVPQAARHSSSWASGVTPMMVLATRQLP